ncbi:DALR anticodon-binding domain-containing protein 3-like isoform X5 [Tachypleus tridentatus]|uniref:DALR anticodon-binding domain-containing protein 3-like isoform X5 n=1 Tax=Tachypleus tridentatus TaxID=6853 RepID=UPI003FD591DA
MSANISEGVSPNDALTAASVLSRPTEEFGNDLLCSVDPQILRLTPHDNTIYEKFRGEFPDFNVKLMSEDQLKSREAKEKWRSFCNQFEGKVEDFNFGTLVRLDCQKDYSEENTIFVTRIQFYAIEIARNKEGHNDCIRTLYKPSSRKGNKSQARENIPRKNSALYIREFTYNIQKFVDKFAQDYISPAIIEYHLTKENGSLKRKDFTLFFGHHSSNVFMSHLSEFQTQLLDISRSWSLPVQSCRLSQFCRLQISLHRQVAFHTIIPAVIDQCEEFGFSCQELQKQCILLVPMCQQNTAGLTWLRTYFITKCLGRLLKTNGTSDCLEFISKYTPKLFQFTDFAPVNESYGINCSDKECVGKIRTRLKTDAKYSYYNHCEELNVKESSGNDYKSEEVILNAKEFLINHNCIIGRQGYDANIGSLCVKTSEWSKLFDEVVNLEHFVMHLPQKPDIVIHVTSYQKAFLQQQIGVLWSMLSSYPFVSHQVYLIHSPVITQDSQNVTIQDYSRRIHEEVESALIHKYGKHICDDESGRCCLETLTETKMIFDILCTGQNQMVKLHLSKDYEMLAEKGGCFVQYNCARLAMLFQHHQKAVNSGHYPPLISVESVDFRLLKLEEEWNLFYNYILSYPDLVSDVLENLDPCNVKVNIPLHRICQMLLHLSRDFSTYYSKVRILVEPRPHLLDTMAARLWLLKGLYHVIQNSLSILGLKPLHQM